MRIAFLIRSLHRGGAERQLVALANELNKLGHQITIYIFYSGGEFEREIEGRGIQLVNLRKKGTWDLLFLGRFIREIRKFKPDYLHGYLTTSNIICSLLKWLWPKTKIVWGIRSSHMDLKQYSWLSAVNYYIEAKISRLPDLIITNSHAGKLTCIQKGFPAEKIVVVSNGIDTSHFYPDVRDKSVLKEQYKLRYKVIGIAGRIDPMKDHFTFFDAVKRLFEKGNICNVICVGDGPSDYALKLKEYVTSIGMEAHVTWTGAQSQMKMYYNTMDVLVSSSYGEGFSNVIGEAMACGVPCVVTDVGDSALIVRESGIVVKPKDAAAMADAIIKILDNGSHYSKMARERIEEHFSLTALAQNTERALKSIR
ncbi:glycosyltransferase [Gorillibacterium sp. sgz5001074]|uniref:glycosyltransferase n=1 Tax=Gorillibacterium sp. sgz5001074 TaxID=3446695 RepID=UPI003F6642A8